MRGEAGPVGLGEHNLEAVVTLPLQDRVGRTREVEAGTDMECLGVKCTHRRPPVSLGGRWTWQMAEHRVYPAGGACIGRGEARSFCYLLSDEPGEDAVERLSPGRAQQQRLDLAQADLELRGPGDAFGLRQSGQPRLRASALLDGQLIITTKAEAEAVLDSDAALTRPEHAGLRTIAARVESGIIGEAH